MTSTEEPQAANGEQQPVEGQQPQDGEQVREGLSTCRVLVALYLLAAGRRCPLSVTLRYSNDINA